VTVAELTHTLPIVNATLNGLSAILLASGYICIRLRLVKAHIVQMLCAVVTSALFLGCYLVYHAITKPKSIGLPPGAWRTGYLIMLFTHVLLAIAMLPMIAMTLWRAGHKEWKRHRAIARPTFFIWFYVSVTGVLVYYFLYHLAPTLYPNMAG
jgi:uncharacterized membrane protein YozB (DUF420 family)